MPAGGGKQAYRNATWAHHLQEQWMSAHDKAIVILKIVLTSAQGQNTMDLHSS